MKILLVSDTESRYIWDHFDPTRFSGVDIVISCGDLKAKYLSYIVTMMNVPVYYVHGNHDEPYTIAPPLGCECIDDKLIEWNGLRILGLGGSPVYRKGIFQYTDKDMWKRYQRLKRKIKRSGGIDILVTHSPAYQLGDGQDHAHIGFKALRRILDEEKPAYHFHGHQHLNYGRGERQIQYGPTTIINGHGYHIIDI